MLFYAAASISAVLSATTLQKTIWMRELVRQDSDGDLYGWGLMPRQTFDFIWERLRPVLSNYWCYFQPCSCCMWIEKRNCIYSCSVWSQCIPDHLQRWVGWLDHSAASVYLLCISTCSFMWSSTMQVQSHHTTHFNARCKGCLCFHLPLSLSNGHKKSFCWFS